ncbi:MAG: hypothetical protein HY303_05810 [Candidatus Wallbacteria bacterium]|nr:hypothetical protein [Candidatus Wallbacteria bacterium]
MVVPACFMCGRRTRRFLVKFALEDCYICRVCENGLRCRRQVEAFGANPDYGYRPNAMGSVAFQHRDKLVLCSHDELMQRYEDEILDVEEGL